MALDATLVERLQAALGIEVALSHGTPVLQLGADQVFDAARTLRDRFGFDMLLDLTAVDWLGQEPRFELVWHFFATATQTRLRMKTRVAESQTEVASLTQLYGSAAFMERECHEMFGIRFAGNADLRPILLYEGFVGHPLRKDYPKNREQPLIPYRDAAVEKPA